MNDICIVCLYIQGSEYDGTHICARDPLGRYASIRDG